MARQRDQAIVSLGVDRDRHGAEGDDEPVHEPVPVRRPCRPRASGTRSRPRTAPRSRTRGRAPRDRRPGGRRRSGRRAPPPTPSSSRRRSRSRARARPRARSGPATQAASPARRRRRGRPPRPPTPSSRQARPPRRAPPRPAAPRGRRRSRRRGPRLPASPPDRRRPPSGPCRRRQGASAVDRAHQLGDLEREIQRLAGVQARVAERRVRVSSCSSERPSPPPRHSVTSSPVISRWTPPGHVPSSWCTAKKPSISAMMCPKSRVFRPAGGEERVRVHRVADPDDRVAGVANGADERRQRLARRGPRPCA